MKRDTPPALTRVPALRASSLQSFRLLPLLLVVLAAFAAGSLPLASEGPHAGNLTALIAPMAMPAVSTPALASAAMPAVAASAVFQPPKGAEGLSPKVLRLALDEMTCARARGIAGRDDLLTVIDYSLPSTQPRLWVLDLVHGEVLFHELVAHGAGSGDNYATRFSNTVDSRQTSLGLFRTAGTYEGGNGYSLKLQGLEPGFNDRAEQRNIVIHGAWYVSAEHARQHGRLGRSWGCPALPLEDARPVIDKIKGGTFVFSYAPDTAWLRTASTASTCPATAAPATTMALATTVR